MVFHHLWKFFPPDRMFVLAPRTPGWRDFDRRSKRPVIRFPVLFTGNAGRLVSSAVMALYTLFLVLFRGVREIHAGQILSCGPAGYLLQRVLGIPCYLWLYGGETTAAYRRSRMEERLVGCLVRGCRFLVTNSPSTTNEFLDFGIPRERIVQILPGVDTELFTPGPRPEALARRHGIESGPVILTVSRLTMRKGHDLVLKALKFLEDYADIYYMIVGEGDDRHRLERLVAGYGLAERVIFAGRVSGEELPDYYRLANLYVMPNREVPEVTDSIEGFGISFIEAAACGKPAIAGASGGTAAAVLDNQTGFLVDPSDPHALADRIRFMLDNPDVAKQMGRRGRERVERNFDWEMRARELTGRLTVGPHSFRERAHGIG